MPPDERNDRNPEPLPTSSDFPYDRMIHNVETASVRLMTVDEVISYLRRAIINPSIPRLKLLDQLETLLERDLTALDQIRRAVQDMLSLNETSLTVPQKRFLDAILRGLIVLLPAEEQMCLVPSLVSHRRAARRAIGIHIVSKSPSLASPTLVEAFLAGFKCFHDEALLTALTRIEADIRNAVPLLLANMKSLYERARVFERLLALDPVHAVSLAHDFPAEFVWGVGRARYQAALPDVLTILEAARQKRNQVQQVSFDVRHRPRERADQAPGETASSLILRSDIVEECLGLSIWALGRLEARIHLKRLAEDYRIDWLTSGSEKIS